MKKLLFLPVKKMMALAVILAGLLFSGALQAQTVTSVTVGSQNGSLVYGTAGSVTFSVTLTISGSGSASTNLSINWATTPTGVTTNLTNPYVSSNQSTMVIPLTITSAASTPGGTYGFTVTSSNGPVTSGSVNFVISGKPVTISGITGHNREYDGTISATVDGTATLVGVTAGDDVTLSGTPAFTFSNSSVGTAKTITATGYTLSGTAAGNYSLSQPAGLTANITAKALTISGLTGQDKMYDGTTVAHSTGTASLSGVLGTDVVTLGGTPVLSFADALVGTGKAITVTGYALSGASAGNYTLTQPTGLTANITTKTLTITGLTGVDKTYDGTTTATTSGTATLAGVISPDVVTLGGTPVLTFADALVGSAKAITVTGYTISGASSANYTVQQPTNLTANITPKSLTVTGLIGVSKVYDRGTGTGVGGTPTLNGVLTGDAGNVALDASLAVYSFADASVGTAKTITATGFRLTGSASSNYSVGALTGVTADITAKPLTITGAAANSKNYDGTNAATLTGTLTGVIDPDVVTLNGLGTFASINANTGISVTPACTLGGADAHNYSIAAQPTGLTAAITPRPISITATGISKVYGTALVAGVSTTNFVVSGGLTNENITSVVLRPNSAGLNPTTPAGTTFQVLPEQPLTYSSSFALANYSISYAAFTGTVSQKPISITPTAGQQKLVGAADPVFTYTATPALLGTDTFTGSLSRTSGETVAGSPYAFTLGSLSAGANYILTLVPANFAITGTNAALITAFNFTTQPAFTEVINQTNGTIAVPVVYSTDVTSLKSVFTASPGATVSVGSTAQTSGVTANNFTSPVTYKVTSADGTVSKNYVVSVTKNAVATGKQLLTFAFTSIPNAVGVINETNHTITVPVSSSTAVSALVATFTVSPVAKVYVGGISGTLQTSGVTANNFTSALTTGFNYLVAAEDGGTQTYTVFITRSGAGTAKQLLTFSLPGIDAAIDEYAHTVQMTIPYVYSLTNKVMTFTSSYASTVWIGATQLISGSTANTFTATPTTPGTATLTVKAEDNSTQAYALTINRIPASTLKQMLTFQFNGLPVSSVGTIDETAGTIAITIPYTGASKASLVATFTCSPLTIVSIGDVVQVSGLTVNNFTNDVVYTVMAEDATVKNYTVHVTQTPASTAKQLLTFGVTSGTNLFNGVVNQTAKSVLVEVPYGTNVTDMVATFTVSQFASVKIGQVTQISGVSHYNFLETVVYRIFAENGDVEVYTIVVRVLPGFNSFSFDDVVTKPAGEIDNIARTITIHTPFSVDKTALKAYFATGSETVVKIGATQQTSGVTPNDFTNPITYTLQISGGGTANYVATVITDAARTGKQLLTFAFNGLSPACTGVIDQTLKTVTVTVPYRTDVTALVPTFTISELASIKIGTISQISGVTANNFTSPVIYTVTSEDGLTTADYTVTVVITPASTAKDITYFAFEDLDPDVVCEINQENLTIIDTVPNGTDRSALRAFYTVSPLTTVRVMGNAGGLQQSGLTTNDFRVPVVYEVTAEDGSTKKYTVTIAEGPDITKPIISYASQNVSNLPGQYVMLSSNEGTGKIYIILEGEIPATLSVANLDAVVAAGYGRYIYVTAAGTNMPISTANLPAGNYYGFAIDNAGNVSNKGTNIIKVIDRIPPVVSVSTQTLSNALENTVNVKSSDANSFVYLIMEGVAQTSKLQLDAAVRDKKGAKAAVTSANTDTPVSVAGLVPGIYVAYAVDVPAENLSAPSANKVTITAASNAKSMLAFSFNELTPPAIGQIVGTDISVKVRVGTPITALVSTFTISAGSKAYIDGVLQVSNVTANDFTDPVTYTVKAEDGSTVDYTVTVTFNTGIEEITWLQNIKAYPNPVADHLTIEMTRPADRIQIVNGIGQTVEDIIKPDQSAINISTGSWNKGIYVIRFYLDGQYAGVKKLIKD